METRVNIKNAGLPRDCSKDAEVGIELETQLFTPFENWLSGDTKDNCGMAV